MGYCGSGGSGRRKALMDKFQQFLENIDESRAVCPESPCGNTGPCASFGHTGHTHPGPVSTFNPPRAPDYLDPNKRPLITNIQVKEFRPTSDLKALRMQSGPEESVWLKEMEDLPKWEDRFRLHPVNPKIVQRVLANKEKGYPPPGEKSPYLYRSPQPKPKVLRPRTFPPECMHHRGEVPCKICDPPFRHGYPECPQEEDISKICPAHWSAPCGHQALGQAAGCPPIQSYPRFVPDPKFGDYFNPNQNHKSKQLSLFHIPAFFQELLQNEAVPTMHNSDLWGMGEQQDFGRYCNTSGSYNTDYQIQPQMPIFENNIHYNPSPRPGTCGTCLDPKPPRTTCPSPCGEPCPAFHPVNLAYYTDPMEPPICKVEFLRQPPCVDHYNKPCGAHERLINNCEEFFGRPCKLHAVVREKVPRLILPW